MADLITMTSAELNNCAISHLQAGHVQEAMHHLMIALSSARRPPPHPSFTSSGDAERWDKARGPIATKHSASINVFGSALSMPSQETSFLRRYSRALYIDTTGPCNDDLVVSAVILFNTAQVHHSIGLECRCDDFLEQASRLYHMALIVLEKYQKFGNRLLRLAIFNNIAHIDAHLLRMGDVMGALGKIRAMMTTADDIDQELCAIDEKDLRLFTMNATFDEKIVFSLAPAA